MNEQIIKQLMPHLKYVVDMTEKEALSPKKDRPKQIWVYIHLNITPLMNRLTAPGPDITQTTFFEATEIETK